MKIALCGSTKFMDSFIKANAALSKRGHVVYSVAVAEHQGDPMTEDDKILLDLVHLMKIAHSDAILVVGIAPQQGVHQPVPYIGDSTRREIAWARLMGRKVYSEAAGDIEHHPDLNPQHILPPVNKGTYDVKAPGDPEPDSAI